jgi:hypothetical protein
MNFPNVLSEVPESALRGEGGFDLRNLRNVNIGVDSNGNVSVTQKQQPVEREAREEEQEEPKTEK